MIRDHNIQPCVAAYAILWTGAVGIDQAIDFIFERENGGEKMQHPYFGYLPANAIVVMGPDNNDSADELANDLEEGLQESDGAEGIENVEDFGIEEVCYLCL